ncbi:arginine decarboxylase [Xenococcus sp. PCC 7305]|uniref:biosynthetic arginine decarboxylase n=1 Tax=Xenococcus sp. PCC 7305 TaxID=102125 RepID=UPI0002ABD2C2|nr:biosynthetic arginine decarboxylase [Xenococcus sp. PCC 7305]ELS03888.1 arginine decarboxylase [Xenococcus sp. PCC 7305]
MSTLNLDLTSEEIPEYGQESWTVEDSKKLYHVRGWGEPYFSINNAGHVTVAPQGDRGKTIDLFELVQSLGKRKLTTPLLVRFSDILDDRIERLNNCFFQAIATYNYPGIYQGVFPIKCNQHRHLVKDLVHFGKSYQFGLEVGSKPELMIALAMLDSPSHKSPEDSQALLICNGYKDQQYIETALLASKLGPKPIIVIERIEELYLGMEIGRNLGIEPVFGVRAKLSNRGTGHWGNSTGEGSKFGLTIPQILEMVRQLQATQMLHCLKLLHFHIGSQISAIAVIKDAIREASQIYAQLVKLGAAMGYLDVGGGLAIDYDGSKTNFHASKNYNMQNYANNIVSGVQETCHKAGIQVPVLVSESGRAIASHQSVLIFDVLGSSGLKLQPPTQVEEPQHLVIRNLWKTYKNISADNYQKAYRDAIAFKEETISLFSFGYLSLTERAIAEQLYWACCGKIWTIIRYLKDVPNDLQDLAKMMASIYYVNLSVFQSAPDSWAIDQVFPIMPIHRLEEEPQEHAILADLTCDSDGKIDQFIGLHDTKNVLELHALQSNAELSCAPYYLGMFLVGAYQEIMGNMHNLFGDTNVVHIQMTANGYEIKHVVKGDTITEVLGYVQYDGAKLLETMRLRSEKALQENRISLEETQLLLQNYERSLINYTYLEQ